MRWHLGDWNMHHATHGSRSCNLFSEMSCLQAHHRGAAYALTGPNPFYDWHVAQRYTHQSQFDTSRATKHRDGAENVRQLVRKAALEGLI